MTKAKEELGKRGELGGVLPPLILPLTAHGAPDYDSLRRHIDFLLAGEVDGLWINGTTGEFFALTDDECRQVVEVAVKHVAGRVPIVAQTGDGSTRRAICKARQAMGVGADFLAVVMPYYLDYSQQELLRYYREIFEAVQQPLIIYQIPQTCKISLTIPSILELTREGVVRGIKESSGNMDFFRMLTARVEKESLSLRCFNGSSALIDLSFMAGGHGIVSGISNLLPNLTVDLHRAFLAKEQEKVASLQAQVYETVQAVKLPGRANLASTIGAYKWLLHQAGIIATSQCFSPFEPLTKTEQEHLRQLALPLFLQARKAVRAPLSNGSAARHRETQRVSPAPA